MGKITLANNMFETVTIENPNGEIVAKFSFNPSDSDIVFRYEEFVKGMNDIVPAIERYEKENENQSSFEKAKGMLAEINAVIYEKFNTFLAGDVAKDIFSVMGPLSPTPYGYYFIFIIERIAEIINDISGTNLKKMESKIQKHTSKYIR